MQISRMIWLKFEPDDLVKNIALNPKLIASGHTHCKSCKSMGSVASAYFIALILQKSIF